MYTHITNLLNIYINIHIYMHTVGIGDAAAAVFGSLYGIQKW